MRVETNTESDASSASDDAKDVLYNFSLAERYAQLSDDELERRADEEAAAEAASSAYEGIPLDKERIKTGLLETYRALITQQRAGKDLAPFTGA